MNDNHSDKPYPGKRDPRMDTDNKLEDPRDPALRPPPAVPMAMHAPLAGPHKPGMTLGEILDDEGGETAPDNAWPLDNCPPGPGEVKVVNCVHCVDTGFMPTPCTRCGKHKSLLSNGPTTGFRKADRPKPNPPELPAPSITDAHVENSIESENYLRLPGTNVTICCITMRNGFTVIGQAHCVSAENFDRLVGQNIARRDATNQIWGYLGYVLKDKLYHAKGY